MPVLGEVIHDMEGIPQNDPSARREAARMIAGMSVQIRDSMRSLQAYAAEREVAALTDDDVRIVHDESELRQDGYTGTECETIFTEKDSRDLVHTDPAFAAAALAVADELGMAEPDEPWTDEHTVATTTTTRYYVTTTAATATNIYVPGQIVNATNATFIHGAGHTFVAHDADYFVGCSLQLGEMTPDVDAFMWAAGFNMNDFLDSGEYVQMEDDCISHTKGTNEALRRRFLQWHRSVSDVHRAYCGMQLVYNARCALDEMPMSVSDWAVSDLLKKGSNREIEDVVFDEEYLREFVQKQFGHWVGHFGESWRLAEESYARADKRELLNFTKRMIQERNARYAQNHPWAARESAKEGVRGQRAISRAIRAKLKRARAALNRSIKLCEDMLGPERLRSFMSGEPILIEGTKIDFRIKRSQTGMVEHTSNPNAGHTPFNLDILNKSGEVLCSCCTFFRDTPVMDQIVAIFLHVSSGDEAYIVKKSNLYNRSDAFYDDEGILEYSEGRYRRIDNIGTFTTATGGIYATATQGTVTGWQAPDPAMQLFGISNDRFREEVIPWRARLRPRILQIMADMAGLRRDLLEQLSRVTQSGDELIYLHRLEPQTLDELLLQSV